MAVLVDLLGEKKRSNLLFLLTFLLSSCHLGTRAEQFESNAKPPVGMVLESIRCVKLSEKLIKMGSRNDEVVLLVFLKHSDQVVEFVGSSKLLTFEKEGEQQEIQTRLELLSREEERELVFVLIEQDTERKTTELIDLVEKALNEGSNEETLQEALEEDDLLGLKKRDCQWNADSADLRFWGLHLFDEYEYKVKWRLLFP